MVRARFGIAAVSVALVAGGLLAALGATPAGASSGSCTSPGKCYLTAVAPQSVTAGVSQAFTFTVTNEATTQTLGSIQVTAPAGFVLTGASGGTSSFTSSSALFLNLGLGSGQIATLTVDAIAPCSGGTLGWTVAAKQSNQFNGPNNGFVLDSASSLAATVSGSCSLAFVNQPNGTAAGMPITTEVASTGSPVSVDVLDGIGNLLTSSTAAVTVAIGANPAAGTLSGTTTVTAIGGVASFPGLSINKTGSGYTLGATSPGLTSALPSHFFDIWGSLQSCSGAQCSGSSSSKTTSGAVTTSSAVSGQFLGVGLGGVTFTCNGSSYQLSSDPLSFDVLSQSGAADSSALFTVSLEVSKQVVQASGHTGASTWQICFGSDVPFAARPGTSGTVTIGGVTYFTGLLPDCDNTQSNAPCVLARNKDNAGNVVVTFLGIGDAYGRM